jgi:quinol-cytochrome oxidoreductase complex cytochrome b subunit
VAKRTRKKGRGGERPGDDVGELEVLAAESPRADEAEAVETPAEAEAVEKPAEAEAVEKPVEAAESPAEVEAAEPTVEADEPAQRPQAQQGPAAALWVWLTDLQPSFVLHVHPRTVLARSLAPVRTLGLGVLSLIAALALTVTGVLLMVYYVPSAEGAYGSIQDINSVVPFGGLVRNIHRWAGHAMVLLVALHMLRTLLTGSYKAGRRGVWTTGVFLLVLTLAFAFTGYLLPWDQLSYWAVSIGGHLARNVPVVGGWLSRALLGGDGVTEVTLVRFYALHVGVLPTLTAGLVALHLYRLRRAGGLARPTEAGDELRVPAWPHLYERELALLGLAVVALVVAGVLFDAPLGSQPDIIHPDNPSKAPWYFLGVQELVSYSSLIGGVIIPLLAAVILYLVPHVDRDPVGAGVWLGARAGRLAFAAGALVSAIVVPAGLALQERLSAGAAGPSSWLNPATLLLISTATVTAAAGVLGRSARQAVLAFAGAGAVAVALLTVVGYAARGASWSLVLPWGSP